MRSLLLIIIIAMGVGCAHTPKLAPEPSLNEVYMARSIQFAMRVVGPATAYDVQSPADEKPSRVRELVAQYSGMVVTSSGLLRPPPVAGEAARTVRITMESLEWNASEEALVRFRFSRPSADDAACEVRVRHEGDPKKVWSFNPRGEEYCWPRPSP